MRKIHVNALRLLTLGLALCLIFPVSAYEFKAGALGSTDGFTCHPSWAYFATDTMSANFTSDRTRGDAPFTVRFFDTSYGYPDTWLWDFGDGNTSDEQNPVYSYLVPGVYDVSLKIGKAVNYETVYKTDLPSRAGRWNNTTMNVNETVNDTPEGLYTDFVNTGKGQLTDLSFSSVDRHLDYITVAEPGSGTDQPIPENFYPEPLKGVTLPSGDSGVVGNAQLSATTVTITPSTQKGYTDTLNINGVYRLSKFTPYNNAF